MRMIVVLGLVALALNGCAAPEYPIEPPFPGAGQPAPPPPSPSPPPPPPDTCGASRMQELVGRPRSEIPVADQPDRWRVACTTCPVTRDYRPDRLNIFFDAQTGIIKEVSCG